MGSGAWYLCGPWEACRRGLRGACKLRAVLFLTTTKPFYGLTSLGSRSYQYDFLLALWHRTDGAL